MTTPRPLELLAPARDTAIARQAILHGADAVYIGASSHGARSAAANSIDDIRSLTEFAHTFRAKVYVTVNTIVYEKEIQAVERLIADLYRAGVDALIIQDMGILRMDIPPIQLHASTQCDISSVAKAKFLEAAGCSQIVLARELTLDEITEICRSVTVPVECFIHGALCVSYSGKCHASLSCGGRSANRGECAQLCRLPYTLRDGSGRVMARDKYLLSMHDFNASRSLCDLVKAGVSSFKIEGRLKDADYVKNVTAFYRRELDRIISEHPDLYCRASFGSSKISFTPDLNRSFNRGFTDFCLTRRRNSDLASTITPKSLGEAISDISSLNNGDGISWIQNGEYTGARVNRVDQGRIITAGNRPIPRGAQLRRTFDVQWEQFMARDTATRRIKVNMTLDSTGLTLTDERGVMARVGFEPGEEKARTPQQRRRQFEKLGDTPYVLGDFEDNLDSSVFIPNSRLAELRRQGIAALDRAAKASYPYVYRRPENKEIPYPLRHLDFRENVANSLARSFYRDHGVLTIEDAAEVSGDSLSGKVVMTSRHCILRQLHRCLRDNPGAAKGLFTLTDGRGNTFIMKPDCERCEMRILKK